MVSSRLRSYPKRHRGRVRNLLTANEGYIEAFMNVDNTIEDDACGDIPSGQEMAGDIASRGYPRIVDVTIRRESGTTETYSLESMTKARRRKMVQELHEFMSADGQRLVCSEHRTYQARKFREESFGLNDEVRIANEDRDRGRSSSSNSSDCGKLRSNKEGKRNHAAQSSGRKRPRKGALESTETVGRPRHESCYNIPLRTAPKGLMVWDEKAVTAFYRRILADGQQTLCRKLAKWWIRAINPNKQTNYPYAKGPAKKPPWWPLTPPNDAVGEPIKGTMENGFVRHKEPDHLAKPERLTLLPYILNQVTDPRNRTLFNCIDVAKLHQISIDSINNETTDKEKHQSWRKFVDEIFRVAKQQERYKNGETDETASVPISESYESWRYKGPIDEAEHDSKSDGGYCDDEGENGKALTPESRSEKDLHAQGHIQPQSLQDDIKEEYSSFANDASFPTYYQNGTNKQQTYPRVNDAANQMPDQPSYGASMAPLPSCSHQPNPMLQEPYRRHSDTSDRFSNQSSFVHFLPNNNMDHLANPQYPTVEPAFPLLPASNNRAGYVLPPPLSIHMVRPLADIMQSPAFHNPGLFPRSNPQFQLSARDPVVVGHGNLPQQEQQEQNFQDYLHNQDFGHNALRMHNMNLNDVTRPEFTYGQDNENGSNLEFSYDGKSPCSHEHRGFDLNDMADEGSNGRSEHVG